MEQQDTVMKVIKDKTFNKFVALGGTAGIVGLIATSEQLVNNPIAQNIGLGSAILGGVAMFGAFWRAATISDEASGRTLKTEMQGFKDDFSNLKNGVSNLINKFRTSEDDKALDDALSHTKSNYPKFLR